MPPSSSPISCMVTVTVPVSSDITCCPTSSDLHLDYSDGDKFSLHFYL
jgi:hypothetical protein